VTSGLAARRYDDSDDPDRAGIGGAGARTRRGPHASGGAASWSSRRRAALGAQVLLDEVDRPETMLGARCGGARRRISGRGLRDPRRCRRGEDRGKVSLEVSGRDSREAGRAVTPRRGNASWFRKAEPSPNADRADEGGSSTRALARASATRPGDAARAARQVTRAANRFRVGQTPRTTRRRPVNRRPRRVLALTPAEPRASRAPAGQNP